MAKVANCGETGCTSGHSAPAVSFAVLTPASARVTTETVELRSVTEHVHDERQTLPGRQALRVLVSLLVLRAKEYATCDSRVLRSLAAALGYVMALMLGLLGRSKQRFKLVSSLHRADLSRATNRLAEQVVRRAVSGRDPRTLVLLTDHLVNAPRTPATAKFFDDPMRLLGAAAIVLKSPKGDEKGLIYAHYNHVWPLLARFFDLQRIAERYHLAIEPSWSGFCDLPVVSCGSLRFPVFVTAYEPRDAEFLRAIQWNLVPIPISANWWVDHRKFSPIAGVTKDIDVVMLAGWGAYKRHYRFFEVLSQLRRQGHRLRAMLIGYSVGWTKETVLNQARYYGIADQLEVHEGVPYEGVNALVNRAKLHLLWSRKEGVNRAIIECMFAGVPSIVREGFNYGYRYPYINKQTGCFATEAALPRTMLDLVERSAEMSPREWVMEHMSCQRATQIMSDSIGQWCAEHGEPWTQPPVTKVTHLHSMQYWDPADAERFKADYEWLADARCK